MKRIPAAKILAVLCLIAVALSAASCGGPSYSRRRDRSSGRSRSERRDRERDDDETQIPDRDMTVVTTETEVTDIPTAGSPGIDAPELERDQLVFHYLYVNYAWGYNAHETFFMGDGDIYGYDIDQNVIPQDIETGEDKLQYLLEYATPIGHIDENDLWQLYVTALSIEDSLDDYEEEFELYDAGDSYLNFADPYTGEEICFRIGGCCSSVTDNEELRALWDMWDNAGITYRDNYSTTVITTELPIYNSHCGYISSVDSLGRFVFSDLQSLQDQAREWGIDISNMELPYDTDGYSYFVKIRTVSTGGYDLQSGAFIVQDGIYELLPSPDNVHPSSDEMVPEMMDGFISIIPFPVNVEGDLPSVGGQTWTYVP